MQAFRDYGVGQFIHFGVYSLPGNEWQGVSARDGAPAPEWIRAWRGPTAPDNWCDIYDHLYEQFVVADFDATRWAAQARRMGARYVILTTKHHDGFCLWPSAHSSYTVAATPFGAGGRDLVGEVVDAYVAEGIDVFLYFSILDWHHPGYRTAVPTTEAEQESYDEFLADTRAQLLELLERYPQCRGLWFDGTWDPAWIASYDFARDLEISLRHRNPDLVIGSRFRADEHGARHVDAAGQCLGDYDQRWERKLPASRDELCSDDWDCVMTIPPNGWSYLKDWSGLYAKTTTDLVELLLRTRALGGNFVINFGPDGDGRMRPEEDRIAAELGAWLDVNGEAVYGTRPADLPEPKSGFLTRRGDDLLYLAVTHRPVSGTARLAVPLDAARVPVRAAVLGSGAAVPVRHSALGYDRDPFTYYDLDLPPISDPRRSSGERSERVETPLPFVIRIELAAPAAQGGAVSDAHI